MDPPQNDMEAFQAVKGMTYGVQVRQRAFSILKLPCAVRTKKQQKRPPTPPLNRTRYSLTARRCARTAIYASKKAALANFAPNKECFCMAYV